MRGFRSFLFASALAPSAFADGPPQSPPPEPAYESGQYISVASSFVGATSYDYDFFTPSPEVELESGWGVTVAWGARFAENWRGELELTYRSQAVETVDGLDADLVGAGDVAERSFDINFYYDFPTGGDVFRPYVGVGLGGGSVEIEDAIVDGSGASYRYHAMAGGAFKISDRVSLFVEGRYQLVRYGVDTNGNEDDAEEHLGIGGFAASTGVRFGL